MASAIRSFIAIELAASHKRSLGKTIKKLAERWPEYRWSEPDQLHLTLNFLGPVPDEKIPRVCQIMRETILGHQRFSLDLHGIGAFPKPARPRVVWAGVSNDDESKNGPSDETGQGKSRLSKLYYDLRENLEDLRLERDRKAYRPHITLGRIKNKERWPDSMIEFLENESAIDLGTVDVDEIVLFSSFEEAGGPVYTAMDRVALK